MVEIIHKRGWDSKVFDTGRGQVKEGEPDRPIYGAKLQNGLHDIESNGSFVDCNPSMRDYIGNVSTLEAIRGRYGSLRAGDTKSESKDRIKILTKRNCGISLKLCGHKTYGPWEDTTRKIRFDTNDGITLNYYPSYKGVNIVITVDNPQTASNIIKFALKKYGCDYEYEEKNGNIIARSSTGKEDIYINALYATDATGDSGEVYLRLGGIVDGYQIIEKVIAPVWFGNAVGPVNIDPSVTIEDITGTLIDTRLHAGLPTWNFGTSGTGLVNTTQAIMMAVDLSTYGGNTAILAKFGIHISSGTYPIDIGWHRVLVEWIEGARTGIAITGEPSWNDRAVPNAWNTAGCQGDGTDRQATPEGSAQITASNPDYALDMSLPTVQAWLDNSADNHGIIIPNVASGQIFVRLSEYTTTTDIPYFYMEYTEGEVGIKKLAGIFGIGRMGVR